MDVTFISYFVTPDQITHQSIDPRVSDLPAPTEETIVWSAASAAAHV